MRTDTVHPDDSYVVVVSRSRVSNRGCHLGSCQRVVILFRHWIIHSGRIPIAFQLFFASVFARAMGSIRSTIDGETGSTSGSETNYASMISRSSRRERFDRCYRRLDPDPRSHVESMMASGEAVAVVALIETSRPSAITSRTRFRPIVDSDA